jgi:ATP-dependent DNA helicase RecG
MIGNTLIHREYSSSYTAKFVIEQDRMYVENANRAASGGVITVDNLEPNPKNPIIASFFRNIGYADQLGSGVRNLFKYSKYYSGQEPQFCEGDVFRIIVPLDESFSYDSEIGAAVGEDNVIDRVPINTEGVPTNADKMPISTEGVPTNADKMPINTGGVPTNADETQYENMTPQQNRIYQYARQNGSITSRQAEELLAVKQRRARDLLSEMVAQGILEKQGHYRSTVYVCADK